MQKTLQCWPENSTAHLPFHPSNPKILKAFPECFLTLPSEMKPTRCPVTKKKQTNQIKREQQWQQQQQQEKKSWYFASGMGHKVLDLKTECWTVLAHYSKTVKKQLDWLQKVIFGKIPRSKWVNVYILLLLWLLTLVLSVLVTVHLFKKNQKQPKTLIASWVLPGLCFWFYITSLGMHIVWFSFILGLNFIFLCWGYGNVW